MKVLAGRRFSFSLHCGKLHLASPKAKTRVDTNEGDHSDQRYHREWIECK